MNFPQKGLTVRILEQTFSVEELTIGHIIGVESKKSLFSAGQYGNISQGHLLTSSLALDLIDCLSIITSIFPTFEKQLRFDSPLDIPPEKAKILLEVYRKEIAPWYYGWLKFLYGLEEEKEEEKKEG